MIFRYALRQTVGRALLLLVGSMCLSTVSWAQTPDAPGCAAAFKGQRINLVVPHKPGGGFDAYARLLAPMLEQNLSARVSVVNMPAANGLAGLQALLRPSTPGVHLLGLTSLTPLYEREFIARDAHIRASDFAILGTLSHGNTVWITRRGEDPLTKQGPVLIGGSDRQISGMHLPAIAMGLRVQPVKSLHASGDSILALLRGDIDILVTPEQLLERGAIDTQRLQPWVFMAKPLNPELRNVPVLPGAGGWLDQRMAGLPPEQRRHRLAAAALSEAFGSTIYAVLVAQTIPKETQACLRQVIESIAFDPGFIAQAERQRLDPRPMRASLAMALGQNLRQLVQAHRDVIAQAIERAR